MPSKEAALAYLDEQVEEAKREWDARVEETAMTAKQLDEAKERDKAARDLRVEASSRYYRLIRQREDLIREGR